jgi:hypothetical protein
MEKMHSADDVIKIMREAAALGMTTVDIPGFKGTFSVRPQNLNRPQSHGTSSPQSSRAAEDLGNFVTTFGKYKGWPIYRIPRKDLQEYGEWLLKDTGRDGLSPEARDWLDRADKYLRQA